MAKKTTLQAIRGMDDVLPQGYSGEVYNSASWTALRRLYSDWAELHGFRYVETPVLEPTELFKRTAGETSDIVSKEMYTFEDAGGRSLSMRPEGSASVCRAVVQHGLAASGGDLRFYYVAQMFRAERPQKGRYRQHTQLGLEIFKESDPTADAEAIGVLYHFLRRLGLKEITVQINSVGSPACRPAYREKLVEYLREHSGKLSADSQRRMETNPMRILDSKAGQDQDIIANAPVMVDWLDDECREHFEGLKAALSAIEVPCELNPRLVRGLDYYTKTAFEVTCGTLEGAIKVIGGGGRFDGLIEQIGGPPTDAVGFGSSIERVLLALESQNIMLPQPNRPKVRMAFFDDATKLAAFKLARGLREESIEVEFPYRSRSLTKMLQAANKAGVRLVAIIGGDEWERGEVLLKDFAEGTQTAIPVDGLASAILDLYRRSPAVA